jgi:putative hemolysin
MTWAAIAVCLLISFVFSGIEAGILSVNRVRLRHRAKMRDAAARKLAKLLSRPERLLVTVIIVTNLMNIFAITLASHELVRHFGGRGYVYAVLCFLPIYLLGLEVLPKSLFRRFPYRALAKLAEPLRFAAFILRPIHWIGEVVARFVAQNTPAEHQKLFLGREEFKYLTIESERTGTLSRAERQLIHNVVDFRAVTAKEVMLPMEKVKAIPAKASIGELLARSQETRVDRWPVLSETGEISGLVNIFEVALDGRRRGRVESFSRRIVKVGPDEPAYSIVRKLRAARATIAAVLGPGAKPLGIVTWEDLVRRLVDTAAAPAGARTA